MFIDRAAECCKWSKLLSSIVKASIVLWATFKKSLDKHISGRAWVLVRSTRYRTVVLLQCSSVVWQQETEIKLRVGV